MRGVGVSKFWNIIVKYPFLKMDDRLVTLTKPTDAPLELGNFISQIFYFEKIHICYVYLFFENVMIILVF